MSTVSKKDLIKAVDELNDKICDPPIKKKDEKKMAKKVLIAAKLIEGYDGISKSTIATIKALKGAKKSSSSSEKTEKKKDKKKKSSRGTKKQGVGVFIVENLKSGKFKKLSNEQIVERVMKKFPEASTKPENMSGYRRTAEE